VPYFVFVEFLEPEIRDFLSRLRDALQCSPQGSPVHITLRGPYVEPPSPDELNSFSERLRGYGVRIARCGYFSTPKGFAIFMRAECSVFSELWDKPDFKVSPARIEPHITLYESSSRESAREVLNFLKTEQIQLHTYDVGLSLYSSKQGELFGVPAVAPPTGARRIHRDIWQIRDTVEDVLDRAKTLGARLSLAAPNVKSDA
jgi:2'-5' RNA ligase